MKALLTIKQVSTILGCTERTIRNRNIPYILHGRLRRYDPLDIQKYIQERKKCRSTKGKARPSTKSSSPSKASGFAEAVKQLPAGKQRA